MQQKFPLSSIHTSMVIKGHMKNIIILFVIALNLSSVPVFADVNRIHKHGHGYGESGSSVGKPGDPNNVSRTIVLEMTFNRFKPSKVNVKHGETIKFIIKNTSKKRHELMIGTMAKLKEHAKMMRNHPDIEHIEPNQVTVASGKTEELVWQFTKVGIIDFACPRHGHFKGMRGEINVTSK